MSALHLSSRALLVVTMMAKTYCILNNLNHVLYCIVMYWFSLNVCVYVVVSATEASQDTEGVKAKKEDWIGKSTTINHTYTCTNTTESAIECTPMAQRSEICLTLFFIFFQREEMHQNNKKPKATIVRQLEETQDKAINATFSVLSSALTKLYIRYINMHGALITCHQDFSYFLYI